MNTIEITAKELKENREQYCLIDIRSETLLNYGKIKDSIHIPYEKVLEQAEQLPKDKKLVFYCTKGVFSKEIAEELQEEGYEAYSLQDGYTSWLLMEMSEKENSSDAPEESVAERVEKSIQKTYRKNLFSKFAKAINEYQLVKEGDKIAICISGGKDSMLMAKLFQELKRHNKFPFELVFLVMDPGYNKENREIIEKNAKLLNIPITIFESDIFDTVFHIEKSPCYLCARMRRGYLYSKAKELGCNKIALGHHFDDVIETTMMGMLYGAQIQTMMPKLHSTNFEGMELIRPMYLIREDDIKRWRDYNGLYFIQCACRFTNTCSISGDDGSSASKRMEIKHLIAQMKKNNPFVESNIFRSMENVSMDTVIGYKKKGKRYHFLDEYDNE